ncbi:MAG: hypothetical protein ACK4NY_22775 [Spirosomataceae bacterium]
MKYKFTILLNCILSVSFAQISVVKSQRIVKLYPVELASNSLQIGIEKFNRSKTQSSNLILGFRYKVNWVNGDSNFQNPTENTSNWLGISLNYEKRFYLSTPKVDASSLSHGFYFAPFLRVDYNYRHLDARYFTYTHDSEGRPVDPNYVIINSRINYFGGTVGSNIGFQVRVFKNIYFDTFLGGGIRLLKKYEDNLLLAPLSKYYSRDSRNILRFVDKAGVVPNAGITLGVSW